MCINYQCFLCTNSLEKKILKKNYELFLWKVLNKLKIRITWGFYYLLFIFNGLFVEYFVYLLLFGLLFIVFLGVKDYV